MRRTALQGQEWQALMRRLEGYAGSLTQRLVAYRAGLPVVKWSSFSDLSPERLNRSGEGLG